MEIVKRLKSPTPKFFKKVRNLGLALTAIGTGIVAAPVALPVAIATIGGYLVLGGTISAGVAQLTKEDK
jgi:amino acid permease